MMYLKNVAQELENAQWVRALSALTEKWWSVPRTQWWLKTICKSSFRGSETLLGPLGHYMHVVNIYIHNNTHTHKIKNVY